MTRAVDDLDEFGKQTLTPLRSTPAIDPQSAADIKANYLLDGENLRQGMSIKPDWEDPRQITRKSYFWGVVRRKTMMKSLAAVLIAFAVILAGSSITVLASQNSLPGQALYPVKSLSEDLRLSMTSSPIAKLSLTLSFTNLRVKEISSLLANGNTVNNQTADRFQGELEDALQLANQLDDTQMQHALGEIKSYAEKQGMTMQELIRQLPPRADPAVVNLQQRLNEQVQLSSIGEMNPKEFRLQVNERLQKQHGAKHSPDSEQSQSTPVETVNPQMPSQDDINHGNDMNQPTDESNNGGSGNGNHGIKPTHTPKP